MIVVLWLQLCSQESLRLYMAECRKYVQLTADACYDTWAWSYDGKNPTPLIRSSSDDESSASCNGASVEGFIYLSTLVFILVI